MKYQVVYCSQGCGVPVVQLYEGSANCIALLYLEKHAVHLLHQLFLWVVCFFYHLIVIQAIERLKQEVSAESPGKEVKVEFMALDLASFQSTKEFTVAFREKNLPLHILVNNAGVAWIPFS